MYSASPIDSDACGRLILVVEDEPTVLEFLCEILEDEGYATQALDSADQAWEFLHERAADVALLLTDITMPGRLNGASLSNLCGEHLPGMPIVVMSGYETPESSGVRYPVSFIRKPWTIGQVLDCVEGALKSAQG
ncbi:MULTISPECIES: response regulator [Pseudomonas]|uniref:Response regulator n=1 Tax=Pseudomonas piscis TaxID=2614538 RepID=A0ABY9NQ84_9PSED|nr:MULTISPECIES: response regulator [Pseudomonas]AZC17825.1 sensor histidine kinase/response regulator [Pseudomonas sp. CMR5c]ERO60703.1 response regulator [Pseudomonas piscis]POA59764.1 response regulator [Pseudomonas sp. FW507-12TSA]WMN20248.1 response regulator [Pseudomonas piscis]